MWNWWGGGGDGLLRHARKREKEMALIRVHHLGTNREITEHKDMRIKGRSKR
jgi:hypothetical protein